MTSTIPDLVFSLFYWLSLHFNLLYPVQCVMWARFYAYYSHFFATYVFITAIDKGFVFEEESCRDQAEQFTNTGGFTICNFTILLLYLVTLTHDKEIRPKDQTRRRVC